MAGVQPKLLRPKLVALDSAHFANLARDFTSTKSDRRSKAETFLRRFDESGCVMLVCWHHVQELLSHGDDEEIGTRVAFVRSLPLLAVVRSTIVPGMLGMVLDVQAYEVMAAFTSPSVDAVHVREEVTKDLIRLDSGANIICPFVEAWPLLKEAFQRQNERAREIVAISRSDFTGIEDVRVADMLNGKMRGKEDVLRRTRELGTKLARDMRHRGDRRIVDPERSAAAFLEEILSNIDWPANALAFGLAVLREHGLDADDIGSETTFKEIGRLAAFRKKLEQLNCLLGLPWTRLKAIVTEARLPSGIIHAAIEQYRPHTSEWKGSDLGDSYLACLAAYADVTFVDKRTHEALKIGRKKSSALASILRRVEKASDYANIPDLLDTQK